MHGIKVDVWGVGHLVKSCGLGSNVLPKMLRELQNGCLDQNPEQRAETPRRRFNAHMRIYLSCFQKEGFAFNKLPYRRGQLELYTFKDWFGKGFLVSEIGKESEFPSCEALPFCSTCLLNQLFSFIYVEKKESVKHLAFVE